MGDRAKAGGGGISSYGCYPAHPQFEHGTTIISGRRVLYEQTVLRTVAQGANFQLVQGAQLVTLSNPGFVNRV